MRTPARALAAALAIMTVWKAAAQTPVIEASETDRRAVSTLLDGFHDDVAHAREDAYFEKFSPQAVFLGTDATERWTVSEFRAFAHPHFEKGKQDGRGAWTYFPRDRSLVSVSDGCMAFDELLDHAGLGICRGSGMAVQMPDVVDRPGFGRWRIAQYNLSIPVPNDLADDVVSRIARFGAAGGEIGGRISSAQAEDLTVISFNVRYDNPDDGEHAWGNRRARAAAIIQGAGHHVHLAGLQEVLANQLDELLADCPRMRSVGVGRDDGARKGEFSPILYRADRFVVKESGTFWLSETPEAPGSTAWGATLPRICTWARLEEPPRNRRFYVFNTHFDHQSVLARERSAELLCSRISTREHTDEPVIVTGDFNAEIGSAPMLTMMRGERPLRDTFAVLHPNLPNTGTFHAFRMNRDGPRIDYVLADPFWEIEQSEIAGIEDRVPASDHFAIRTLLKWPKADQSE